MTNPKTPPIRVIFSSFIGLGIFIVLFIVGLVFFSYLLIIGGIIGLILFSIAYLRAKLFAHKTRNKKQPDQGRIIDHEK